MDEEKYIKQFSDFLDRLHKRKTSERFAILRYVMGTGSHFSIDIFCEMLENDGFHVSKATVYNTLELLIDCGLVRRHIFDSKSAQYEKVTSDPSHQHLVCIKCGKMREVSDRDLVELLASRRYKQFSPLYTSLTIYGLCSRCARKSRRSGRLSDPAGQPAKQNNQ